MRAAAAALAARGHRVWWDEPTSSRPPGVEPAGRVPLPATIEADIVLGGSDSVVATAFAGWCARARAMVLSAEPDELQRWGAAQRLAWASLYSVALVEESAGAALRLQPRRFDLDRFALWSAEPPSAEPDPSHGDAEVLERACERSLARHRGGADRPAVFLDRDGTLVVERGYLSDPTDIELLPGVPAALRELHGAGFALVVISNQSGVGRGLFPSERVHRAMARLRTLLRERGVELDAVYFCPHRPEDGCDCRKPGTALIERAVEDLRLGARGSFMIGDKRLDVATGQNAGGRGILLRTGYGREEEQGVESDPTSRPPDAVCDDLPAAARWILEHAASEYVAGV